MFSQITYCSLDMQRLKLRLCSDCDRLLTSFSFNMTQFKDDSNILCNLEMEWLDH